MGRPPKEGLDYFPHRITPNTKFALIEAEFGIIGYVVYYKLLERIHGEKGYYMEWNNDVALLFKRDICPDREKGGNVVSEIVTACLRRGIFNNEMYKKHKILTSEQIQDDFKRGKRGAISRIKQEYLLLSVPESEVFATETGVFDTETGENIETIPQNKQNKNKQNKTKSKQNKEKQTNKQTDVDEVCSDVGLREFILEQVEYDILVERAKTFSDKEMIDNIIDILIEVLESKKSYYTINGEKIAAAAVKARLNKLRFEHIEYVFNAFNESGTEVKNIRGYTISLLYNSYACCSLKEANETWSAYG